MSTLTINSNIHDWMPPEEIRAEADNVDPATKQSPDAPDDSVAAQPVAEVPTPRQLDPIELEDGEFILFNKTSATFNIPPIARKFAQFNQVAWDGSNRQFYKFDAEDGIWKKLDENVLRRDVSDHIRLLAIEREANDLLAKRTPGLVKNILEFVKSSSPLGAPAPRTAELLPVKNGVLDLSGNVPKLRAYTADDWFTSQMPVAWNPEAKCPSWVDELLAPSLKHAEDLLLLQRALGSMLIGGNPAQFILLAMGLGGSGKSTMVSSFEKIVGHHRVAHLRTDKLNTRFETHFFQSKDLLVAKDVRPDFLQKGGSSLKWLTGADGFETEQKYGGKFQCTGTFNVVITANTPPLISLAGDAEAWTRRIIPITFAVAPTKRVLEFDKLLVEKEGEGILAWLVAGYKMAQAEFSAHGFFELTQGQKTRRKDFVDASQSTATFVRDRIIEGVGDLAVQESYEGYVNYCRARGWRPETFQKFSTQLPQVMTETHNTHRRNDIIRAGTQVRGFRGVTMRQPEAPEQREPIEFPAKPPDREAQAA